MFQRFRDYYNVYETAIPRIFRYQLLTKPILIPMNFLFNRILKWLLSVTGIGTITNANFLSFLFHPASLLMILLFLVMAVFYTIFDVNAMVLLSTDVLEGRRRGVFELIREAALDLRLFKSPSGFLLILYITFARPFTGVGAYMTLTKDLHPIETITNLSQGNTAVLLLLLAVNLLILVFAFLYLFSLHFTILGNEKPLRSFQLSRQLVLSDKWGAIRTYFFMLIGIALPSDLISIFFRGFLPDFLFEKDAPLTVCFAVFIFGFLLDYTCKILVAPLQTLRLTEYYLSRVQPEAMVRPKRDKRTWLILRISMFTAVGLLIGFLLSSMLPLFRRHITMAPYEGGNAKSIITINRNADAILEQMQENYGDGFFVRFWMYENVMELEEQVITESVRQDKKLFIELSGNVPSKEVLEGCCQLIKEKGAPTKTYLIVDSENVLRKIQEKWPNLTVGLRIVEGIGNVAQLGADFYVFEAGKIKGSQIADLKKQGAMVCLEIQDPMSYYEAFISLEAYPDAVFTEKEEVIWVITDELKEMRGDEWMFHVLQAL